MSPPLACQPPPGPLSRPMCKRTFAPGTLGMASSWVWGVWGVKGKLAPPTGSLLPMQLLGLLPDPGGPFREGPSALSLVSSCVGERACSQVNSKASCGCNLLVVFGPTPYFLLVPAGSSEQSTQPRHRLGCCAKNGSQAALECPSHSSHLARIDGLMP